MVLPRLMLRKCRKAMFRFKLADSMGTVVTGGALLMRTLILRRLLRREVLQPDEKYVGILIPPTVGHHEADPELPEIDLVVGEARPWTPGPTLSNSFGFGGHNGCLIIGPA